MLGLENYLRDRNRKKDLNWNSSHDNEERKYD